MKEEDKSKLVEVFNGSLWEAELVKSLLENNGIESTLKDGMVVNIVLPETAVDVGRHFQGKQRHCACGV